MRTCAKQARIALNTSIGTLFSGSGVRDCEKQGNRCAVVAIWGCEHSHVHAGAYEPEPLDAFSIPTLPQRRVEPAWPARPAVELRGQLRRRGWLLRARCLMTLKRCIEYALRIGYGVVCVSNRKFQILAQDISKVSN